MILLLLLFILIRAFINNYIDINLFII